MRVDKVDKKHKTGVIKYNSESEMQLVNESMDILIDKQTKMVGRQAVDGSGRLHEEPEERRKLERYKQSKDRAVEMPKKMKERKIEKIEGLKERVRKKEGLKPGQRENIEDLEEVKQMEKMRRLGEGQGLTGDVEVSANNIYDIVNALNEHIVKLEKDGTHLTTEKTKYDRLVQMLENAQQQKAQFERVTPKPKGYGRLRK